MRTLRKQLETPFLLAALLFAGVCGAGSGLASEPEVDGLAQRIDRLLDQHARQHQVVLAAPSSDAAFLRRITLDLVGRIPTASEVHAFLDDPREDKRAEVIDRLLGDPAWARHNARVWRTALLCQASPQDLRYLTPKIERWLERQFRDDVPYDVWVRKLLTTPMSGRPSGTLDATFENEAALAFAFFQANELKPENLASATSRVFLGVNLDCAQCHNHPFADWKQDQFWQLAAFYAGIERLRPDNSSLAAPENLARRELLVAGTERVVQAMFLDGRQPALSDTESPRLALAGWVASAENPFFARSVANRVWSQCFGRGLIEPLEGLGGRTPSEHDDLLELLGQALAAHRFDLKWLTRGIVSTAAYQRSSRQCDPSQTDARHFARMTVRGLSAEQVVDSLLLATGGDGTAPGSTASPRGRSETTVRDELLTVFTTLDRPQETHTSIVQALTLMNGKFLAAATTLGESRNLMAVVDAPFLDEPAKIEALYVMTLGRRPTDQESRIIQEHLAQADDRQEALGDLLWALLNSGEFLFNH